MPVVRRLTGKGLPFSAAIADLLGGPVVNPVVAASRASAYAFDWRRVLLRLGLGCGIAVAIVPAMGRLFASVKAIKDNGSETPNQTVRGPCVSLPILTGYALY
ncbi:MAG: permease [Desulfococcaceae bacterium]